MRETKIKNIQLFRCKTLRREIGDSFMTGEWECPIAS